jgi:O-6-methylguanine DNA methyltransferase
MIVDIRDQLDDLLTGYFRPEPTPSDLASRIARSSRSVEADLGEVVERLVIRATSHGVSLIRPGRPEKSADAPSQRLADQAREEVVEYLRGQRVFFSVPVDLSQTPPFQRRVLEAARQIPFGEARAYGWVAGRIGSPRAVRAVGTALGKNPVPLIVPCHRVWRSDGSLGGYLFGEALKRRLLDLERSTPVLDGNTSTRVVCRVGCMEGRHTRPEDRIVFASVEDARSVGYRPCKVCRPSAAA